MRHHTGSKGAVTQHLREASGHMEVFLPRDLTHTCALGDINRIYTLGAWDTVSPDCIVHMERSGRPHRRYEGRTDGQTHDRQTDAQINTCTDALNTWTDMVKIER